VVFVELAFFRLLRCAMMLPRVDDGTRTGASTGVEKKFNNDNNDNIVDLAGRG